MNSHSNVFLWHAAWLYTPLQNFQKDMIKEIGTDQFEEEVLQTVTLNLVEFKADWRAACQIVSMIYTELAGSYSGAANFFTVNIDEEVRLGIEYGIIEIPTILFFKGGQIVDFVKGLTPKNILIAKIERALEDSPN